MVIIERRFGNEEEAYEGYDIYNSSYNKIQTAIAHVDPILA